MKISMLLICLLSSISMHASFDIFFSKHSGNIAFHVDFNEGSKSNHQGLEWRYAGLCQELNAYLESTKSQEVEIEFNVSYYPYSMCKCCQIQLTRSGNVYFIDILYDDLSLDEYKTLIEYCLHKDWTSFVCQNPSKGFQKLSKKKLFERIEALSIEIKPFTSQRYIVDSLGGMSIQYFGDSLGMMIDHKDIEVDPLGFMDGVKSLQDRYLFEDNGVIYVMNEKGVEVNRQVLNESKHRFFISSYRLWANIYNDGIAYSYSYEQNRFIKVMKP
ncbi:MAG: hypothetical protein MRY83_09460 [Flavobacteriales bacterium]|nr:hypothetical protein [Flavobacteriales bacterium]